ncbi:aldehyde dehydrogenase family protein [Paraburkholderia ginsengiterrae]|uniref:NAD-dependent phenylacetaldehyde dehydrogenase n=1 Tax=Paraburkholderia ginsengiterrae TaxID=1462993 RepID=A0A1A9N7G0_9BURK|nr:aldehyde dehydrogenase family protein [Paraburkholderia ginsengiterrae]OAJ61348.1 NAD-dependent phenylacetaldehyde dehydrogenase [Paraburkholderia ginsengiterrae]
MNNVANVALSEAAQKFLSREHCLFINGGPQSAHSSRRLDVFNPATGEVLTTVPDADAQDVDRAVANARDAFDQRVWSGLRPADRERILLHFADVLEDNAEELAQLETLNQGKSINIARAIEVGASVEYVRYMAGWATKITGETLDVSIPFPPGARYTAFTRKEPVGVVAGIVPWNFPLMIAIWKLIPALAAGCTIVIKPSPETPLTALRLAELAIQAGIPPGVFNVVTGGRECGSALAAHPGVNKISFTGSTPTGKLVGAAAGQNMTRFSLELGGKNPAIMLADVDVDQAVQGALAGGFLNQGQVCAAVSRIYVHRSKYRQIADGLADMANAMTLGPGLDPSAQINPLVSSQHRDRVEQHIAQARHDGLRFLAGGTRVDVAGYYVRPTVIADVPHDAAIIRDEVFGPVLALVPFDDPADALRLANDSPYGLAASLWTNDLRVAMNLVRDIDAGTVWVNSHVPLDPSMPFGGMKQSGMGREFGKHAVEAFTEIKSVCIAH